MSDVTTLSLKKRVTIVILFLAFLAILVFLSFFVKKTGISRLAPNPSPTLVPVEISRSEQKPSNGAKIESAPAAESNNLGTVAFNYKTKKVPASGTVYTQAPTSIPADMISRVQEKLIAGGEERIINTPNGQVMFMEKDTKTLTIYLYSRTISYSDSSIQESLPTDPSSLISRASDFIKSLSLPFDDKSPTIKFFSEKTGDLTESTPNTADSIDVSFKEPVQGLTVYRQFGSDAAAHVWFSKRGEINKFTYLYAPQYIPQKTVILPTLSEAEEMIKKNKGTIVRLGDEYQQPSLKSPSTTTFESVEVGYFNDGKDTILYPVFVFKGESVVGGVSTQITVYLPAT